MRLGDVFGPFEGDEECVKLGAACERLQGPRARHEIQRVERAVLPFGQHGVHHVAAQAGHFLAVVPEPLAQEPLQLGRRFLVDGNPLLL